MNIPGSMMPPPKPYLPVNMGFGMIQVFFYIQCSMFNLYPQATSYGNMTISVPMMPPPQPSTPMNMGFGMMPGHGLTQWPMTQVCIIGTFEIVVLI